MKKCLSVCAALLLLGQAAVLWCQPKVSEPEAAFEKRILKASEGLAGLAGSFKTDEGPLGLILRGKAAESDELTGQEMMAFGLADGTIVAGGAVYSPAGEDLMCKYVSVLNREVLRNTAGLYQSQKLKASGKPVKTLYVFIDPLCGNCRIMRGGELPAWFEKNGVQLLWVPVSIFNQSQLAGADFLESGTWQMNSVFDQNIGRLQPGEKALALVSGNLKRLLRLHPGQEIPTPFLFWEREVTADDLSGLGSFVGIPTVSQAQGFINEIIAAPPRGHAVLQ